VLNRISPGDRYGVRCASACANRTVVNADADSHIISVDTTACHVNFHAPIGWPGPDDCRRYCRDVAAYRRDESATIGYAVADADSTD